MLSHAGGRTACALATAIALLALALVSRAPAAAASGAPQARVATASDVAKLRKRARKACSRATRLARRGNARRAKSARRVCRVRRARARRAFASTSAAARLAAPVLRVSGDTIAWNRVADITRYVLATTVPGRATTYKVVTGTRVTPPAVAGKRVNYGLRTDVTGSRWAREVSVTYGAGKAAPAPAPVRAPAPAPVPAPANVFEAGVVSGSDVLGEVKTSARLGAKLVRIEFAVGKPAAELRAAIAANAANGTRVLPLAGFHARMPTVAEARNLASWAREFGPGGTFWAGRADGHLAIREIEFGNETSYGYQYGDNYDKPSYSARAREYALRLKDAHEAIEAANPKVGLLGQIEDANTGSRNWINGVFAAVPDIAERVTGWTIHPYGPRSKWEPRMDRLLAWTAEKGAKLPMWVTEYGFASDDGRCLSDNYGWDRCMGYGAAASALTDSVGAMRARYGGWLRTVILYQGRDQYKAGVSTNREHYFGALQNDLSEKGAYTAAVRSLLAAR